VKERKVTKAEKLAAGILLLRGKSLTRRLAGLAATHAALAADRAGDTRLALLGGLMTQSDAFADEARRAIRDSRAQVREDARDRLRKEIAALGIVWIASGLHFGDRHAADDVSAHAAADSLAAQWRGLAMARALKAQRLDEDVRAAIRATGPAMVPRVARTAQTEVAQAYNDEHRSALREAVQFDKSFRDGEFASRVETLVKRRWSALLDACSECWPLDGETVGLYEAFTGGEEPGFVHPHCRCVEVFVSEEGAKAEAA